MVVADFDGDALPAALPLRFMGGLHRLVLGGEAPELARQYPTAGGSPDGQTLPEALLSTVDANIDSLREALEIPPQTNEIGRSVALLAGLVTALGGENRPVRLLEIGSSAGLNLMLDKFSYETSEWSWSGDSDAPTLTPAWIGAGILVPQSIEIVTRRGCDTNPIDVTKDVERHRLVSFVFSDQLDRFERINKACDLVRPDSFQIDEADAGSWLAERLYEPVPDGTLTVVQHSVMWQYLQEHTKAQIDATFDRAGDAATESRPLAHVAFESSDLEDYSGHVLTVERWPDGQSQTLGFGQPHGAWFTSL